MAEQWKSKNSNKNNRCLHSSKIVCCAHGIKCDRAKSPSLLHKECHALLRKSSEQPNEEQQYVFHPEVQNKEKARRIKRSYFQEKSLSPAVSLCQLNTEMSDASLLLPAFSKLRINFESANANIQIEGLRNQPYIANEKLHPQQYEEDDKNELVQALLEELYIGCKTTEEAEQIENVPCKFHLYHRKHDGGDFSQLFKPLPLYLFSTSANCEFRHDAVDKIEVVKNGVKVLLDSSVKDGASPSSTFTSDTSLTTRTSSQTSNNSSDSEKSNNSSDSEMSLSTSDSQISPHESSLFLP